MEHRLTETEWQALSDIMVEVSELIQEMAFRIVQLEKSVGSLVKDNR